MYCKILFYVFDKPLPQASNSWLQLWVSHGPQPSTMAISALLRCTSNWVLNILMLQFKPVKCKILQNVL